MERSGLFLSFLLIAAGQDVRRKCVDLWVYLLFGGLAVGLCFYQWRTGCWNGWIDVLSNACVGLGMIAIGILWKETIGLGDGCFFMVSGFLLGFWENLALLFYGLLLCGSYCLFRLVWEQIYICRNIRKQTVPFLPFLVPVGIWLTFGKMG